MAVEVIMPALGMTQESGLLMTWYKRPGEAVRKGEPLMEVETDKATVEIEAEADGILTQVTVAEGDSVPVGTTIAYIVSASEAATAEEMPGQSQPESIPEKQSVEPQHAGFARVTPVAARVAVSNDVDLRLVANDGHQITKADVLAYLDKRDGHPLTRLPGPASPLARRLARENAIAIETVPGTGPGGAVLASDVRVAVADRTVPVPVSEVPKSEPGIVRDTSNRRWESMAERLTIAWQTIPHFYLRREIDATQLLDWLEAARSASAVKITMTDLLVMTVARALRHHPRLNASWLPGEGIIFNDSVNVGLAVAVEDGLLVPVIHQADTLGLSAIAARRRELVERTLSDKLKPLDLQDGTFTISNLGMYHVDAFDAIVNPPQAAILAIGQAREQVVPYGGQPVIRPIMTLSLSCDHRVVDGARGAEFLETVTGYLETPLSLLG